jgi:hypothetical protein
MTIARFLRIFFGAAASAMLVAGLGEVLLRGQLTLMPRSLLALLLGVVIAFVLQGSLRAMRFSAARPTAG